MIFQGLDGLTDPLFKDGLVTTNLQLVTKDGKTVVIDFLNVDSLIFTGNDQTIPVVPAEPHPDPRNVVYGENTHAAVAQGYATLQEHHYGRQALVLPTTIYADTYAARATTLEIPAIIADRLKAVVELDFAPITTASPAKK
jgi:hypothetical protein